MPDDKMIQSSYSSTPTAAGHFLLFAELAMKNCFNDNKNVSKAHVSVAAQNGKVRSPHLRSGQLKEKAKQNKTC